MMTGIPRGSAPFARKPVSRSFVAPLLSMTAGFAACAFAPQDDNEGLFSEHLPYNMIAPPTPPHCHPELSHRILLKACRIINKMTIHMGEGQTASQPKRRKSSLCPQEVLASTPPRLGHISPTCLSMLYKISISRIKSLSIEDGCVIIYLYSWRQRYANYPPFEQSFMGGITSLSFGRNVLFLKG